MENKEIQLREVQAGDENMICDFFEAMGGESRAFFSVAQNSKRILGFCKEPTDDRRFILAVADGVMYGYVFFIDWSCGVPTMGIAVRDGIKGMGLGTKLINHAISMARDAGRGGMKLTTHIANIRAQSLYESVGFRCMGQYKNGKELFYLLTFPAKS